MPHSPKDKANLKRFGQRVQQLRETSEWSRAELADRAGFHRRYIRDLEVGDGNASLTTLMSLAAVFNITLAELLTSVEEDDDDETDSKQGSTERMPDSATPKSTHPSVAGYHPHEPGQ